MHVHKLTGDITVATAIFYIQSVHLKVLHCLCNVSPLRFSSGCPAAGPPTPASPSRSCPSALVSLAPSHNHCAQALAPDL